MTKRVARMSSFSCREVEMNQNREKWIARRAYELWEQAGQPEGQEHEHWSRASAEWDARPSPSEPERPSWDDEE
ncbi:DUF2934 domain-containing protein [Rhizobium sp.]|uniref:DUF2934 domain-containing protein n=1 Tax=Rhizobium sp. TaxID=391 RepID=UPI002898010D